MVKKRKNNLILYLVIIAFIISLIIFLGVLYMKSSLILDKKEIDAIIEVTPKAGFAVTNESLVFGRLPRGTSSQKEIILTNDYEFPIIVELSAKGDIKDFLVYDFIIPLGVGEKKKVTISTIKISEGTEYGNYTGKLVIVFKKDVSS